MIGGGKITNDSLKTISQTAIIHIYNNENIQFHETVWTSELPLDLKLQEINFVNCTNIVNIANLIYNIQKTMSGKWFLGKLTKIVINEGNISLLNLFKILKQLGANKNCSSLQIEFNNVTIRKKKWTLHYKRDETKTYSATSKSDPDWYSAYHMNDNYKASNVVEITK